MRKVALRAADVNSDPPGPPHRRRTPRVSAIVLAILGALILILATACGESTGQPPRTTGTTFVILSVGVLIVAVVLLNTVGKLMGELFAVMLNLTKVLAVVGLTTALVIAAVILAVVATASS